MQLLTTLLLSLQPLAAGDPSPLGASEFQSPAEVGLWLDDLEKRVRALEARQATNVAEGFGATVCLDIASDFVPMYATRSLPAGVSELSVAIEAREAAPHREIEAVFVAVDVGDAAPAGTEMARSAQPTAGDNPVRFRYRQERPLPTGSYRVDLARDGVAWRSLPFRVERASADGAAPSFPLAAGKRWTYDFLQVAGEPARRFQAVVEIRVADTDGAGSHVEIRRDGALLSEEWWTADAGGLLATRRITGGETFELSPPQPLLAADSGVSAWDYGEPAQRCRQWGPLPLSGPWGRGEGFLVRTEQEDGGLVHTVEREFVPDVGLVRERITTARGGHRVAVQELVLRKPAGD